MKNESLVILLIKIPILLMYGLVLLVITGICRMLGGRKERTWLEVNAERDVCEEVKVTCELKKKNTNFDPESYFSKGVEAIKKDLETNKKSEKVRALMELRSHAFCYNFTFMGVVESTKFPKIQLEDLEGGKLPEKYLVQKVDFGYNINKALSKIFNIPLKKHRGLCESYLVLEDGIVYNIEEELSKLLMNPVKIKFIDKDEKIAKIR